MKYENKHFVLELGEDFNFIMAVNASLEEVKLIDQDTKDTVNGYIRNVQESLPEDNAYYNIPKLIIYWCLLYYDQEEFVKDPALRSPNFRFLSNTKAQKIRDCYNTAFFSKVAKKGIHEWKFRLNKFDSAGFTTIVGIWKTTFPMRYHVKLSTSSTRFYGYYLNNKTLTASGSGIRREYGEYCREGDVIEMILNLNKLQLSYRVTEKDYGIAFNNIEDTTYRAALCLHYRGDIIELLSYQRYY